MKKLISATIVAAICAIITKNITHILELNETESLILLVSIIITYCVIERIYSETSKNEEN